MIGSELCKSSLNKMNTTPIKTLIAHEMSQEVESKHSPNVVAKLMGLDTLPLLQPKTAAGRCLSAHCSRHSLKHPDIQHDRTFLDNKMHHKADQCEEQSEYEDVHEILQQSLRTNSKDFSPLQRRYNENENANAEKMALVRQKFMEAKNLATNEMGRQSKEFQDALEVLSSNRDLFLKFLQEQNSLFSQHLYDSRSAPPPPVTKRITVLKPSKAFDDEKFATLGEKRDKRKKEPALMGRPAGRDKKIPQSSPPFADQRVNEYPAQSTQIVVLKPSPGNAHAIKSAVSPPSTCPKILHNGDFYAEFDEDNARESREVAKEITRRICENLMGHRSGETIHSSVLSNGYIGNDISFKKLDGEHVFGNLSDSELMSPISRYSWDCFNRFGSPYSSSSFSHASCSPESSVCREAKKRLSERWVMVTTNGVCQEQTRYRRSSGTLGDMLALSETKKPMRSKDEAPHEEQESLESTTCFANNLLTKEGMIDSTRSLLRSKSSPLMSSVCTAGLSADVSEVRKEPTRAKSSKSSFKEKVSILLFSLNKKSNKEQLGASQCKSESKPSPAEASGSRESLPENMGCDSSQHTNRSDLDCSVPNPGSSSKTTSKLLGSRAKRGAISPEGGLWVRNPLNHANTNENQDQPSPISVLEHPFKEDENRIHEPSSSIRVDFIGNNGFLKGNLIDKSPPIGSIARTIRQDDSCAEVVTAHPLKASLVSSSAESYEHDWVSSVQTLLLEAGLDGKVKSDLPLVRLYSLESPLDPSLREKHANLNDKELLHEAKRRQMRSHQKLIFDSVNAALVEIIGYMAGNKVVEAGASSSSMLLDMVLARIKNWFHDEVSCGFDDGEDMSSWGVDRAVRKEVTCSSWVNTRSGFDDLGMEIEGKLIEDLVEEAVVDLTCWV